MHEYRTHNCSELGKKNIGEEVKISGFVNVKRDHGDLLFLDIRDFYGITQCVVEASNNENIDIFAKVKLESVVTIEGLVVARGDNAANKNLATGEIEIQTKQFISNLRLGKYHFRSMKRILIIQKSSG